MSVSNIEKSKENWIIKFIKEWGVPLVCAVIMAWIIKAFIFFNVSVPTPSMVPTVMPGDRIFVTRVHNKDNLKRGDILVFDSEERQVVLFKRLIGIPGDVIKIENNGEIYINDIKQEEPYVVNQVKEGVSYGMNTGTFTVPENHLFFLGDNRNNSLDARYWNNPYINKDCVKGKARFVIFPFNRVGKLK